MRASRIQRLLPAAFALGAAFLVGLESPVNAQHSNGCTKTLGQRSGSTTVVREIPNSVLPVSLQTSTSTSNSGPGTTVAQSSPTGIVLAPVGGTGMSIQQSSGPARIQNTRLNWRRMVGRYDAVSRLESGCPGGGKYQTTQILGEVGGPLHPYAQYFRVLSSGKKGSTVPFVVAGMFGVDSFLAMGGPSAACYFPTYRMRQLGYEYDPNVATLVLATQPPYHMTHDLGGLYVPLDDVFPPGSQDAVISGVTVRIMGAFVATQKGLMSAGTASNSAMAYVAFETSVFGATFAYININNYEVKVVGNADIHGVKVQGQATVRNDDVVLGEGSIEVKPTRWSLERQPVVMTIGPFNPPRPLSKSFYAPGYTVPLFKSVILQSTNS